MKTLMAVLLVAMAALTGGAYASSKVVDESEPTAWAEGDAWATVDSTPEYGITNTFVDNYAYADPWDAIGSSYAYSESIQENFAQFNEAYSDAQADAEATQYAETYATTDTFAGPGISQSWSYANSYSTSDWVESIADSYGFAEAYGANTYTDAFEYTYTYADPWYGESYSNGYATATAA